METDRQAGRQREYENDRQTDRQTCREKLEEIKAIYRQRQTIRHR